MRDKVILKWHFASLGPQKIKGSAYYFYCKTIIRAFHNFSCRAHQPNSHAKYGWQKFTDAVIKYISENSPSGIVFLLWGGFAQKKEKLIDTSKHQVIKTAHPSPLSCTKFYGCKCFSQVNKALEKLKKSPINWSL